MKNTILQNDEKWRHPLVESNVLLNVNYPFNKTCRKKWRRQSSATYSCIEGLNKRYVNVVLQWPYSLLSLPTAVHLTYNATIPTKSSIKILDITFVPSNPFSKPVNYNGPYGVINSLLQHHYHFIHHTRMFL